jgi:hypothetical protein
MLGSLDPRGPTSGLALLGWGAVQIKSTFSGAQPGPTGLKRLRPALRVWRQVDAINDKFGDQRAEPKLSIEAGTYDVKGDHGQHATVQF